MADKARVLVFNRTFLPGFKAGGPIRSISNLIRRLEDRFDFAVVTRDRDMGDTVPYPGMKIGDWNWVEGCKVFYLAEEDVSGAAVRKVVRESGADLIYLNSFFDAIFTQRVMWARRFGRLGGASVCVAPRGEFSEGAMAQKRLKKRVFITLAGLIGLYKGVHWHASSELEAADIRRELPWVKRDEISIALNLAPPRDAGHVEASRKVPDTDELVIAFLSRIVPKKNLSFALEALAQVKAPVRFLVFGTREDDAYWKVCADLIERLPSNVRVEYRGFVHPDDVPAGLAEADLFFFPTLGENYGHVIHEALCAGLPVLLSDQTPWEKVVDKQVGWIHPLGDAAPYARSIDAYWAMSVDARAAMAQRAIAYGDEVARNDSAVQDHIRMFERLTGGYARAGNVSA